MNDFLKRAFELKRQMQNDRRNLHQHAEAGEHLPNTTAYVTRRLREIGLEPQEICDSGLVAVLKGDKPGKTILIRADMDALPMGENNDLPYKTITNAAHCCGHDLHTAMSLCAAQLLYERKDELCGQVKFMFQPSEEIFTGSKHMIEAGLLENPTVDAAIGMHVMLDTLVGKINYGLGYMSSSCDGYKITITGKGTHGAMPEMGIDPINVGVHIYQGFQSLIAREVPSSSRAILTMGSFNGGATPNIIPNEVVLQGTLRTYDAKLREKLFARMHEICEAQAKSFGATVQYEVLSDVPSVYSDPDFTKEMGGYAAMIEDDFIYHAGDYTITPSDDFAFVSEKVPTAYFMLGATVEGCTAQHHNPGVLFNEDALPYGAATHATCAFHWLKNNL